MPPSQMISMRSLTACATDAILRLARARRRVDGRHGSTASLHWPPHHRVRGCHVCLVKTSALAKLARFGEPAVMKMNDAEAANSGSHLKRRTQADRSTRTRERVILAAIEVLHTRGYSGTTVKLIKDAAGISLGALQHQFPTKANLMAAVVDRILDNRMAIHRRAIEKIEDRSGRISAILDSAWANAATPQFAAMLEIQLARRSDPELEMEAGKVFRAKDAQMESWLTSITAIEPGEKAMLFHQTRLMNNFFLQGSAVLRIGATDPAAIDDIYRLWKPIVEQMFVGIA
jgi:AcrR family transcriptional regulator